MSKPGGQFAFMEVIALISAICVAGIFFYAHYDRQSKQYDLIASDAAQALQPKVTAFFEANPDAVITPEAVAALPDLKLATGVEVTIPHGSDKTANWTLHVIHREGQLVFIVSKSGVTQKYR